MSKNTEEKSAHKLSVDGCGCICIILATCWGICWIIEAYGRYVLTK